MVMSLPSRLLRVLPVTLLAVLAFWAATLNNDDYCGTVGECLSDAFDDVTTLAIVIPIVGVTLRLLGTGRVLLHLLTLVVVGGSLWYGAGELLRALDPTRSYEALLPFPVVLAVGVITGVAATYVVGPGGGRTAKVVVAVLTLVFPVGAQLASDSAQRRADIDQIKALGITVYAPVLDGHRHEYGYASEDAVRLSYSFEVEEGTTFADVTLLPAPAGSLCEVERSFAGPECTQVGDTMRDSSPGSASVGLVRGDTALIAKFDAADLDAEAVLAALRDAPVVDAEDLL